MDKKIVCSVTMAVCCVVVFLAVPATSLAVVRLLDGKLLLNGFIKETAYIRTSMQDREEEFHDTNLGSLRTSVLLEALYSIKESRNFALKVFGGVKWWYEAAPRLDDNLRRHIPHRYRKDYIQPRNFEEDVLTEAYIDIINGPLQFKIGKQIVVWGDLDINRAADVVNPLDLRFGFPGIDTWEELKRGIWMIRAFYQSQLPGNLLFEVIFNPGDFKMTLLPEEGTQWGAPYHASNQFLPATGFGAGHWLFEKMRRDAPGWNLKDNYEFGFRLRGYTWDIDWTLMYYNSLQDGPIANPNRAGDFFRQYLTAAIPAQITGSEINPGDWPDYQVFKYKRSQVIGGTMQAFITRGRITRGSILKAEWFYEIGTPFNKGTRGSSSDIYKETRRDVLGLALNWYQKISIPGITQSRICTGKQFELSLTYFFEKIFNHDHDLVQDIRNHRPGDSVAENITLWFMQAMFNQTINLVFIGNYWTRIDKWMAVPTISYIFPGRHWRADVAMALYGGAKNEYTHGIMDHKDSIILRLRYEW